MRAMGAIRNAQLHQIDKTTNFLKCGYTYKNKEYSLSVWPEQEKIRVRIKSRAGKWYDSSSEDPLSTIDDLFTKIRADLGGGQQVPD